MVLIIVVTIILVAAVSGRCWITSSSSTTITTLDNSSRKNVFVFAFTPTTTTMTTTTLSLHGSVQQQQQHQKFRKTPPRQEQARWKQQLVMVTRRRATMYHQTNNINLGTNLSYQSSISSIQHDHDHQDDDNNQTMLFVVEDDNDGGQTTSQITSHDEDWWNQFQLLKEYVETSRLKKKNKKKLVVLDSDDDDHHTMMAEEDIDLLEILPKSTSSLGYWLNRQRMAYQQQNQHRQQQQQEEKENEQDRLVAPSFSSPSASSLPSGGGGGGGKRSNTVSSSSSSALLSDDKIEAIISLLGDDKWYMPPYERLWELRYEQLQAYKERYGNCHVPIPYPQNQKLAHWVQFQRQHYKLKQLGKPSRLTDKRQHRLDEIGFVWNQLDHAWDLLYQELQVYKAMHGNCCVPRVYPQNQQLGNWVSTQRQQYKLKQLDKSSQLTQERQEKLDAIGFVWDTRRSSSSSSLYYLPQRNDTLWNLRYEELQAYRKRYGICFVPMDYPENIKLANWLSNQRRFYRLKIQGKQTSLTQERQEKLDSIGFLKTKWDHDWELRYQELESYKKMHGNCCVPSVYPSNIRLSNWVVTQRQQYRLKQLGKPSGLTQERQEKLDEIDFAWNRKDYDWEIQYQELQVYREMHGNCCVPRVYPQNQKLGNWVRTQRQHYKIKQLGKPSQLTKERQKRLDAIGFFVKKNQKGL